jgi:uncharacterized protein YndB with AHSA1/START domain
MSRIVTRITIDRPIADVFAVLTDVEQTGTWFPGNVQERWTSPPPRGVGSTRHAVVTVFGRRTENDAVVTAYEPPHRAVMEGTSPNAPFVVTLAFAPLGRASSVTVTSEIRVPGLARIAGPLVIAVYGRAWARGLARLKGLMEAGLL